ncbi:TFIIH basal transcription factor complex p47 subunit [Scedosporium apiospermum]|uniref:General transcription and DNA repair factor IIH n=1 Tax=Pseudallescheria apiosperma TaxID=563466 RepID=A0A084G6V8_PSEDA|nr:TFIIH basal transcription factor complex p47 subunit [Scedosporium apiospermum]KEZ43070.1 TFIIH basal transcription factor complex p47 subunit [Scedosporium apiospermum]
MSDSDGEYVADDMSDDFMDHQVTSTTEARDASRSRRRDKKSHQKGGRKAAWEDVKRSWDTVVEGQDGSLSIAEVIEAQKRKRLLRDTTPLERGIIRHLMLVIDMSFAMAEKDLLPTRYRLTMTFAAEFVKEYFEQNPISQMGIIGMKDGVAVSVSEMSGNPTSHLEKVARWRDEEPKGNPSYQNALEMCRGALFNTPSHGTREVLIVSGAILSSDPGDINETIASLIQNNIRVSIIGLAAQVSICEEICRRTNAGDTTQYNVAMDEKHFRELFLDKTTPPVTRTEEQNAASLLMMGFPSRTLASGTGINYCACHNKPLREGYRCTRCGTKVCRIPADCPGCGLTLILSTHLARSYHHLLPLRNFVEVPWSEAARSTACFACQAPFPEPPKKGPSTEPPAPKPPEVKGVSESSRYACKNCHSHFCVDCDVFCHETVHNCPGCEAGLRKPRARPVETNGNSTNGHTNGAMIID